MLVQVGCEMEQVWPLGEFGVEDGIMVVSAIVGDVAVENV